MLTNSNEVKVVALREKGITFTEIGKMLGITRQRAFQIYKSSTLSEKNTS